MLTSFFVLYINVEDIIITSLTLLTVADVADKFSLKWCRCFNYAINFPFWIDSYGNCYEEHYNKRIYKNKQEKNVAGKKLLSNWHVSNY